MIENNHEKIEQDILELLEKNPGLHISKIAELLSVNIAVIQVQIDRLQKQGSIQASTDKGYNCYFIVQHQWKKRHDRINNLRNNIYTLIVQNPGIYTSKIAELIGISTQLTDYHLVHLERKKKVFAVKENDSYYRKYYTIESKLDSQEIKILEMLSKRIPFEIILLLLKHTTMQHNELSKKLGISPSKLSYHLGKLLDYDIINVQPYGEEKGYVVKNRDEILQILRRYQQRITLALAVNEFQDVWDNFSTKK
jgi:predicted transcriptional regulator